MLVFIMKTAWSILLSGSFTDPCDLPCTCAVCICLNISRAVYKHAHVPDYVIILNIHYRPCSFTVTVL